MTEPSAQGRRRVLELMQTTDLSQVPKWERFVIDEKTSIDVPINDDIDARIMHPGDEMQISMAPDQSHLTEIVIARRKRLS